MFVPQYTLPSSCFHTGHEKKVGLVFENTVAVLKLQNCEMLQRILCVSKHVLKKGFSFGGLLHFGRIVVKPMQKFDWTLCAAHVEGGLPNLLGITSDLKRWVNRQTGF